MAGLNYGRRYLMSNDLRKRKEGVVYIPKIKKYLVRIKINGNVTTMCSYKKKAYADKKYLELTKKPIR